MTIPTAGGVVSGLGAFGSWAWILLLGQMAWHRRASVRLADCPPGPPPRGWPSVAILFAARNEADGVETAARSMLAQGAPVSEVIAVDDRSTDATGAILDALAPVDPRLRVVHVRELPSGWLGKNHALQAAAETTAARWLLLTDADVVFAPGSVGKAVGWAEANGFDHLILIPEVPTETWGERVFLGFFALAFALHAPPWRVTNARLKASAGVGAFNLVRADAFRSIGGLRRLALTIDDDVRLGQALKFAGYRAGVVLGTGEVSVRWQVGLGGMVRGLEKNFFAALGFRVWAVPCAVAALLVLGVFPFAGVFVGPWWQRAVCGVGVAAVAAILEASGGPFGVRWYHALGLPLGALAFALALVRSTVVTLRQGGVRWRDHHYPLGELKDHVRRRDAWLRELWLSTH